MLCFLGSLEGCTTNEKTLIFPLKYLNEYMINLFNLKKKIIYLWPQLQINAINVPSFSKTYTYGLLSASSEYFCRY